jgi:hypothetical protein
MVLISKELNQKYTLSLLPGATTDFFGFSNDSLSFKTVQGNR